jgi:hypothetical protein
MAEGSPGSPSPHRGSGSVAAVVLAVVLAPIVIVGLLVWQTFRGDLPSDEERVAFVERLEATVLPVIEQHQVEYFMDGSGCVNLAYLRGDFIDGDPEDCGGSTDNPLPFDDVARDDHDRLAAALDESRTPIERTRGTFNGGDLRFVFFTSTDGAPFATSWEILYDPDDLYPKTTTDPGSFTPIPDEDGWWFVCCAD